MVKTRSQKKLSAFGSPFQKLEERQKQLAEGKRKQPKAKKSVTFGDVSVKTIPKRRKSKRAMPIVIASTDPLFTDTQRSELAKLGVSSMIQQTRGAKQSNYWCMSAAKRQKRCPKGSKVSYARRVKADAGCLSRLCRFSE